MQLFLVGLPGSGKTTLGKQLSERLGLKFIDLDQEIVDKEGKDIHEIFQEEGEEYFRKLEAKILRRIITDQSFFVMASGGGTPCYFDNMSIMNEKGITLFLNIPTKNLAKRIIADNGRERPLLKAKNEKEILEKLEKLSSERERFYQKSAIILDAEHIDFDKLTAQIQAMSSN